MCSTTDARLSLLGRAIDELAAAARAGLEDAGPDGMAERLAGIWAMVAELDPGLAQRLPRYTDTSE